MGRIIGGHQVDAEVKSTTGSYANYHSGPLFVSDKDIVEGNKVAYINGSHGKSKIRNIVKGNLPSYKSGFIDGHPQLFQLLKLIELVNN